MTNVMHTLTYVLDGGLEKVVYMICENLGRENYNHTIVVLSKQKNSFLLDKFRTLGAEIEFLDFDNRLFSVKSLAKNLKQIFILARLIKKKNIQVLHTHDFFPALVARLSYLAALIFFFKKIPLVYVTLHNIFFWLKPIHHRLNKLRSGLTTKVICVSKSVLDYSLWHDKLSEKKYQIIFNGVNVDEFAPNEEIRKHYRRLFECSESDFIIGNIGVLSVRKGQKYLVDALSKIDQKKNICLLIFGSERSHEKNIPKELYELIQKNSLSEKVKILEPRDDINLIYNMFDVFVMPSIVEGLSLCAIEAMLMKKICLFSDIDPFTEMIDDGVNGFICKREDSGDLALKLDNIISHYEEFGFIGEKARETALHKYNVERMAKEYKALYDSSF